MNTLATPLQKTGELLSLDSKIVSDSKALYEFESKGKEKCDNFRNSNNMFYCPIKKSNFEIFENSSVKKTSKTNNKIMKQNCVLLSNLYVYCLSESKSLLK